jgi:predicted ester cyclase
MGTPEENKALWRRFVDEVPNQGNVDALDELVDDNVVFHVPDVIEGREALKDYIRANLTIMTDISVVIDDLIAEGDRAVGLVTVSGTMIGEYMGHDVDGKQLSVQVAHFLRFSGGRIVEDRHISDSLGVLVQLGFEQIPQPAQTG